MMKRCPPYNVLHNIYNTYYKHSPHMKYILVSMALKHHFYLIFFFLLEKQQMCENIFPPTTFPAIPSYYSYSRDSIHT